MFSAAPGAVFLGDLESFVEAGGSMLDLANVLAGTTLFRSSSFYPPFLFPSEFAPKFVDNLFSGGGVAASDRAWAVNWIIGKLNAGESVGKVCYDAILALDAVGDPVNGYSNTAFASVARAFDNRVTVADYYSVQCGDSTDILTLQSVINNVTSDPTTVDKAIADLCVSHILEQTIELTAGTDVFHGTAGNDLFIGRVNDGSVTSPTTLQSETDVIDGGAGLNRLQVLIANQSAAFITPNATNVQVLQVNDQFGSTWDLHLMPQVGTIASVGSLAGSSFSYVRNLISTITIDRPDNTTAAELSISTNPSVAAGKVTLNLTDVGHYGGAWLVDEHDYYGNGLLAAVTINSSGDNTHFVLGSTEKLVSAEILGGAGGKLAFQLTDYDLFTSLDASQYHGDLSAVFANDPNAVTVRLGSGNDYVELTAGHGLNNNNAITLGGGIDTVKVDGICVNGQSYDSIAGFIKGDTLDLSALNLGTSAFTNAKVTLAATAVFQDYLDAVCAGNVTSNGVFGWFQWGGDSYLVEDRSAAATFQNGIDFVIKLAGLVDLGHATGTGVGGTYGGDGILIGG